MHPLAKCAICNAPSWENVVSIDLRKYNCLRCGNYDVNRSGHHYLLNRHTEWTDRLIANASGWIREHQGEILDDKAFDYLASLKSPSVAEKAAKILKHLAQDNPNPGATFYIPASGFNEILEVVEEKAKLPGRFASVELFMDHAKDRLPWLAVAWAVNGAELKYLVDEYLRDEMKYLHQSPAYNWHQFTPKGWSILERTAETKDSNTAFVAMWFDKALDPLWTKAIEPGIENSGYHPLRIDKHHHNNKIDDEILASIRRSRFIVADFTGQRGGVYFEAGFAMGLGLQVIWLCKKEEIKKIHFDTRQYNFILWEKTRLPALRDAITNRIISTLGLGAKALESTGKT